MSVSSVKRGSCGLITRNMEETGILEKTNLSAFCYLALNQVFPRPMPASPQDTSLGTGASPSCPPPAHRRARPRTRRPSTDATTAPGPSAPLPHPREDHIVV